MPRISMCELGTCPRRSRHAPVLPQHSLTQMLLDLVKRYVSSYLALSPMAGLQLQSSGLTVSLACFTALAKSFILKSPMPTESPASKT